MRSDLGPSNVPPAAVLVGPVCRRTREEAGRGWGCCCRPGKGGGWLPRLGGRGQEQWLACGYLWRAGLTGLRDWLWSRGAGVVGALGKPGVPSPERP